MTPMLSSMGEDVSGSGVGGEAWVWAGEMLGGSDVGVGTEMRRYGSVTTWVRRFGFS